MFQAPDVPSPPDQALAERVLSPDSQRLKKALTGRVNGAGTGPRTQPQRGFSARPCEHPNFAFSGTCFWEKKLLHPV